VAGIYYDCGCSVLCIARDFYLFLVDFFRVVLVGFVLARLDFSHVVVSLYGLEAVSSYVLEVDYDFYYNCFGDGNN
jgi:hypothetical protein